MKRLIQILNEVQIVNSGEIQDIIQLFRKYNIYFRPWSQHKKFNVIEIEKLYNEISNKLDKLFSKIFNKPVKNSYKIKEWIKENNPIDAFIYWFRIENKEIRLYIDTYNSYEFEIFYHGYKYWEDPENENTEQIDDFDERNFSKFIEKLLLYRKYLIKTENYKNIFNWDSKNKSAEEEYIFYTVFDFIRGAYQGENKQELVKPFKKLLSLKEKIPEVLKPSETKLYRGLTLSFDDLKNLKFKKSNKISTNGDYFYYAKYNTRLSDIIQSWTSCMLTAEIFANSDNQNYYPVILYTQFPENQLLFNYKWLNKNATKLGLSWGGEDEVIHYGRNFSGILYINAYNLNTLKEEL